MYPEVIGQIEAKDSLSKYSQRIPSALMIYGPTKVGKYSLARSFVRSVFCLESGNIECKCKACVKLRNDAHPDLHLVQNEKDKDKINIDTIRKLSETWKYTTSEANHKFAIIRRADLLSNAASQALLKLLEEPGDKSTLILTTSSFIRLPVTIRSRCQFIKCSYLSIPDLTQIASNQQKMLSPQSFELWSGIYNPDAWVEQLNILRFAWDPSAIPPSHKIDPVLLKQELLFVGSVYCQMLKDNSSQYREVFLLRPTSDKLSSLFYEVDRALWYLDRGVNTWLVMQWFANRVRSRN